MDWTAKLYRLYAELTVVKRGKALDPMVIAAKRFGTGSTKPL